MKLHLHSAGLSLQIESSDDFKLERTPGNLDIHIEVLGHMYLYPLDEATAHTLLASMSNNHIRSYMMRMPPLLRSNTHGNT